MSKQQRSIVSKQVSNGRMFYLRAVISLLSFNLILSPSCYISAQTIVNDDKYVKLNDDTIKYAVRLWRYSPENATQIFGPISQWDTSEVTDMSHLFFNAMEFDEDLSQWNTSAVTNMQFMFHKAKSFTGNSYNTVGSTTNQLPTVSNKQPQPSPIISSDDDDESPATTIQTRWDVSKVQSMRSMFSGATSLTTGAGLGLADWNTSSCRTMNRMFAGAIRLEADLSRWNTSQVTDLSAMLEDAHSLTSLNVSGWNISQVTTLDAMFQGTYNLQTEICFGSSLLDNNNNGSNNSVSLLGWSSTLTAWNMFCCSGADWSNDCPPLSGRAGLMEQSRRCSDIKSNRDSCRTPINETEFQIVVSLLSVALTINFLVLVWMCLPTTYIWDRSKACVRTVVALACCHCSYCGCQPPETTSNDIEEEDLPWELTHNLTEEEENDNTATQQRTANTSLTDNNNNHNPQRKGRRKWRQSTNELESHC